MGLSRYGLLAGLVMVGAACGGTAVVESGSGGAGGTGNVASSGQGTTTAGPGSSGNSGQTGPSGQTGQTGQTSSGDTTTSTSSGPSDCDGTGICGDSQGGCIQCALEGPCAPSYDQCISNDVCIAFADCLGSCPDPSGCFEGCAMQYPEGADLYVALLDCVICQQCAMDCSGNGFWDCAVPPNP